MASAWGSSWGVAWGNSWGSVTTEQGGVAPTHTRESEEYDFSPWIEVQRVSILEAVQDAQKSEQEELKPKLSLKKKTSEQPEISQAEINQLALIQNELDLMLAIEYHIQFLIKKRRDDEAIALLLLS